MSNITIKRINKNLVDVFYGMGWENWVRISILFDKATKRRSTHVINSVQVPSSVWHDIRKEI